MFVWKPIKNNENKPQWANHTEQIKIANQPIIIKQALLWSIKSFFYISNVNFLAETYPMY